MQHRTGSGAHFLRDATRGLVEIVAKLDAAPRSVLAGTETRGEIAITTGQADCGTTFRLWLPIDGRSIEAHQEVA